VELFHRIGRGVRLTPAGNALLFSLACVYERHIDCVGAKVFGLGATTVNIS
jgi:hypothetical protein